MAEGCADWLSTKNALSLPSSPSHAMSFECYRRVVFGAVRTFLLILARVCFPGQAVPIQPSEREKIIFSHCLDLYHKSQESGELQHNSRA